MALEENKSFGAASDFYIGEMEALRKQLGFFQRHLFSVAALYCLVSNYGTSVATSLRMLLYLYLLHLGLSLMTSASPPYPDFAGEALQSLKLWLIIGNHGFLNRKQSNSIKGINTERLRRCAPHSPGCACR